MKSRVTTILAGIALTVPFLVPAIGTAQEFGPVVFVSSTSSGNVGGVAFADEDILAFDPATDEWELVFDGSDVGLGPNDINAFHVEGDDIFMAFKLPQSLGDFTADDSDVVHFSATSLGAETAGTFALLFDGSDVGLSKNSEEIDAISGSHDGRLLISTSGGHRVPRTGGGTLRGADEDLIAFNATSFGDDTSGSFERYFDGSDVGLRDSGEDVWGAWVHPHTGALFLTAKTNYSVPGLRGDQEDIFTFSPDSLGNNTTGTFAAFWDGDDHGFSRERIDGFSIAFEEPPPQPQFQASLNGDWVQGWNFTPNDYVTVEIFAPEGGEVFSGTVVTDGDGYFSLEPHVLGVDLMVDTYITVADAVDTKTLVMVNITFDTFDTEFDIIGGTAPAGALVEFGVGSEEGDGFGGETDDTSGGTWFVDLALVPFDLTDDMGGQAWVSDEDGDQTVADGGPPQPPQFQASLTNNWIQGWNFTPESTLTVEILVPDTDPVSLPVTTDPDGYFNLNDLDGLDLVPDTIITVTDTVGAITKTLVMVNVTFETFDTTDDQIGGFAPVGETVGFGVGNGVDPGFDGETLAIDPGDGAGIWFFDLANEPDVPFDLADDMGGQAWVSDSDGDQTVAEPPPPPELPQFQASLNGDWVQGWNFTPGSTLSVEILVPTASDPAVFPVDTDGDGYFNLNDPLVPDLVPDTIITVIDTVGTITKTLVMVNVTFETFDLDTSIIGGTAPTAGLVGFNGGNDTNNFDGETTAGPLGWSVDIFADFGFPLTDDMGGQAWVSDFDGDQTVAEPPPPPQLPQFQASLTGNWIQGWNFASESTLTVEILVPDTDPVAFPVTTDTEGYFNLNELGAVTLVPGTYITVATPGTPDDIIIKDLVMVNVTFETFNTTDDEIGGFAPVGETVGFGVGNGVDPGFDGETLAIDPGDGAGIWFVELSPFDLTDDMGGQAWVSDGDGDQTVAEPPPPPQLPQFQASLTGNWIQGWNFASESTLTVEILVPDTDPVAFPVTTDTEGYFNLNELGAVTLVPGTYITVATPGTPDDIIIKDLVMVNVTFETFNTTDDEIGGFAPVGETVGFGVGNGVDPGFDGETLAIDPGDGAGIWFVELSPFDLTDDMGGQAWVSDGDGDQTVAEPPPPPQLPQFQASLNGDWVQGWNFTPGSTLSVEILVPTASDPAVFPVDTDGDGYFNLNDPLVPDLVPDTIITVIDTVGTITKTLVMVNVTFETFDLDTSIIGGTAPTAGLVGFNGGNDTNNFDGETTAGPLGWSVDIFADFGFPLTDDMGGQAWVSDFDGDQTVAEPPPPPQLPQFQASLTGNWIQGWNFASESTLTVEILVPDTDPVAFPVTTDTEGYFNLNELGAVTLVPGTYITVATPGTPDDIIIKDLVMVNVTFETFNTTDDEIGGFAPVGETVGFGVGNGVDPGFDGETLAIDPGDGAGIWFVELSPFDLTDDMGGQAWVSDGDGDQTVAEPPPPPQLPQFQASLTGNWIQGWNFASESTLTVEILVPDTDPVAFPVTTDTEGYFNLNELGAVTLVPGTYITVATPGTPDDIIIKDLVMVNVTFETFNTTDDEIGGFAPVGETVGFGVGNGVDPGFDGETLAIDPGDGAGIWFVELSPFDLTDDMGGQAWVSDGDGDQTVAEPPPPPELPQFQASLNGDWVQGWNFTPGSTLSVEIVVPTASDPAVFPVDTDGDGYFNLNDPLVPDLVPDTIITVIDTVGTITKTLVMVNVTFETFDLDTSIIGGTTPTAGPVGFNGGNDTNNFDGETTAGPLGWSVNILTDFGFPLTDDMGGQAWVSDGDGDQTVAEPPPPPQLPQFQASLNGDWVQGWNFTPGSTLSVEIVVPTASDPAVFPVDTDADGYFNLNDLDGLDLVPETIITVIDTVGTITKTLEMVNVTFETFDTTDNIIGGFAPTDATVGFGVGNGVDPGFDGETIATSGDIWSFNLSPFDLTDDMGGQAWVSDFDGDQTVAEPPPPPELPQFQASLNGDWVQGWNFTPGSTLSVEILVPTASDPAVFPVDTDGDGYFNLNDPLVPDLVPDTIITVIDTVGTVTKTLEMVNVTFETFDTTDNIIGGFTPTDATVGFGVGNGVDPGFDGETIATSGDIWSFNLSPFDLTDDMGGQAWVSDSDGDQTVAEPPPPPELPQFQASLNGDWVQGWNFTPGSTLSVEIVVPTASDPAVFPVDTDGDGYFNLNDPLVPDLVPDTIITVIDTVGTITKTLVMVNVTFETFDLDTSIIGGTAPTAGPVGFNGGNDINNFDGETTAGPLGWSVNILTDFGFPLTDDMGGQAYVSDIDGDQTVADSPPPPT